MTSLSERGIRTLVQGARLLWLLRKKLRRSEQEAFEALLERPDDERLRGTAQQTLQEALDDDRVDSGALEDLLPKPVWSILAAPTLAILAALILLIFVILFYPSQGQGIVTIEYFCVGVLPIVEASLSLMFIVCLGWAVILYSRVRNRAEGLSFRGLANIHKLWSQVWFNISLAIFLGGMIYAIFHVGESICGRPYWKYPAEQCIANLQDTHVPLQPPPVSRTPVPKSTGDSGETPVKPTPESAGGQNEQRVANPWVEAIKTILPNIFIFSLFFVIWQWSSKHYRVHWHNYVTNVFRHRALVKIADLEEGTNLFDSPRRRDETVKDLRIMAAMLLLLPVRSAYAEKGEEAGETGAERIIKVEEMLREIITRRAR